MTEAPNYNDGLWHGWNGGECPVDPDRNIEAVLWDGTNPNTPLDWFAEQEVRASYIGDGCWRHSPGHRAVIAFRVVKPAPPQPRTLYLCEDPGLIPTIHKTAIDATKAALSYGPGATVSEWREVLS